jgi:hypothetical protein
MKADRGASIVLGAIVFFAGCAGRGPQSPAPLEGAGDRALAYRTETRTMPRPLRIHVLEVDLAAGGVEVVAAVADDPDGSGPAEACLEEPKALAERKGLAAAVNANAFAGLRDAAGKRDSIWFEGKPVEILGSAVEDGKERSAPQDGYAGIRIDGTGSIRRSGPADGGPFRQAVAGFGPILEDGVNVGRADALHPRTAAGWDGVQADPSGGRPVRRRLWLAVVDGRRKGFSEGMTTRELGDLMMSLGCRHAVNLDGGGSSVLLLEPPGGGALRVMNSPSGGSTRPVPVLLGLRKAPRGAPVR